MTTSSRPKILLVNDDGIQAPGLRHLWEVIRDLAEVVIVAPHAERSGAGVSISMHTPLHLRPFAWGDHTPAYSLSGTPADCVKMAFAEVLDTPPDLILSGINPGTNSGRNVFYSGTIGGVIEGSFHDVQGAALSCYEFLNPNFKEVKEHIPALVDYLLTHPLPTGTILNVNFPPNPIKGFRLAKQGKSYYKEEPDRRKHPDGFHYYWLAGKHSEFEEEEESDIALLKQGFMTAVPIKVTELTHMDLFESHNERFQTLFKRR